MQFTFAVRKTLNYRRSIAETCTNMKEQQMQTLMTAQEVAKLLRISQRRFEQMVATGSAPRHCRIGRLRRWKVGDVDEWLTNQPWTGAASHPDIAEGSGVATC